MSSHRDLLEQGRTYEFLQVATSLARRKLQRKKVDEALFIASEGIKDLLSRGDKDSAVALLGVLEEALEAKTDMDIVQQIYVVLPPPHKFEFLKKVLKFCKAPVLYVMLASDYQEAEDYGNACLNWVKSGQVTGLVTCLKHLMTKGLAGEQDLIVARAALQLIAIKNLESAKEVLRHFSGIESPILNFAKFLVQACELQQLELVDVLKEKYAPSLARDPNFSKYMQQIEHGIFGREPPANEMSSIFQFFRS
mmetsp:Transcript_23565/g.41768  ORF Transcript_23565/g.41768 Transcript_23565/m.41768 type:complete len:251 (+) Transcript_23565:1043-1795(+)|eukprot:CAMPEP_0204906372 /NCGR_PEP_ID=MMETSP1397-20131031/5941_1 /ASSEMBLY_ACC=CAM_ASM_000891 /TAXON_ID=49980 /ORGANISM="Climacostomum Climacostomum virens, Strain Stock W-24" /LENGTH=250 /DNA_ID=CAMNT_0052075363 /DNA_START=1050 /DNA_END=1802 /DNA_ORIENTATION=+